MSVAEECLVVAQELPQVPEVADTGSTTVVTDTVVVDSLAVSDSVVVTFKIEAESDKPTGGRQDRLTAQVSLPTELVSKLGRQDSCESVGSMEEEEGIQADSAPEGPDPEGQEAQEGSELEPRSERSSSVVSDGSEEGGRDSGIEAEREPDMVVPDEDLMTRIVAQVEFYFSDANVAKDKFLLKHIRRNKEGYVSLKLVSSFKKVKQLTKDWRVVAHSLNKCSSKIQINDVGTKIRRVDPLPDLEEVPVTCAVLVLSLPLEKPSIQSVSELFSSCGEIAFIRVVRVGSAIPQDLKSLATKHPSLTGTNCAWVEFETPEAAKAATDMSSEDGMKVVPILTESHEEADKTQQQKTSQPNSRKNSVINNQQQKGPASRKNSTVGKFRKDSNSGTSESDSGQQYQRYPRRKCLSLPQTQSPNLKELSAVVEARRNRPKSKSCTEFQLGSPPSSSSWVEASLAAVLVAASRRLQCRVTTQSPTTGVARIIQLPTASSGSQGSDGSKGSTLTPESQSNMKRTAVARVVI
nr:LOW QUALITY PROTEIN: la-related protein 6-like [Cherax quadricarinatus]